jgi:hypothetical protein
MPRTLSRTARRGLNESDTTRNPRLRFGSRAQLPVARLLGPHRRSALAGRFITLTQTQQTPPPRPRTTPSRRSWFRRGCERVRDEARHAWCGRRPGAWPQRRHTLASGAKAGVTRPAEPALSAHLRHRPARPRREPAHALLLQNHRQSEPNQPKLRAPPASGRSQQQHAGTMYSDRFRDSRKARGSCLTFGQSIRRSCAICFGRRD